MSTTPAGLRYGTDSEPGIRRRGYVRFSYVDEQTGRPPPATALERIRALAVPPAWTDVWIARDPRSHLQATGRDSRGRKQYRYHPRWSEHRSQNKFADLVGFGEALPRLRRRVVRDLRGGSPHDQVVAAIVRLLDVTGLRVGNPEYARENGSFGLTTLRSRHVRVRGTSVRLSFRGKSEHDFDVTVDSARLARIVRRCQEIPGQRLFRYRDGAGELRPVESADVNAYLAEYAAPGVTAKTFRTWNATIAAAARLAEVGRHAPATAVVLNEVIDSVADDLGNTRAVCRTSYVHPGVVQAFVDGKLAPAWARPVGARPQGLTVDERRALRLLRRLGGGSPR